MEKKQRCVIIGAAEINNYFRIKAYLQKTDVFVYCDGGLKHEPQLKRKPDLIVGDFDSFSRLQANQYDAETISLPRAKDDTDSMYAAKTMLERGYRNYLFLGMMGQRVDHSLANIALLLYLHQRDCHVMLVDDYAEYEIVAKQAKHITQQYPYFSLLAINGIAEGVNIIGAKFLLKDGIITPDSQFAISNEPLQGQVATVAVKRGELLLMRLFER